MVVLAMGKREADKERQSDLDRIKAEVDLDKAKAEKDRKQQTS